MVTLATAPVALWRKQAKGLGRIAVLVCEEPDGNTFPSMLRVGDSIERATARIAARGARVVRVVEVK